MLYHILTCGSAQCLGVICITQWRDILKTKNAHCGKPVDDPKLKHTSKLYVSRIAPNR